LVQESPFLAVSHDRVEDIWNAPPHSMQGMNHLIVPLAFLEPAYRQDDRTIAPPESFAFGRVAFRRDETLNVYSGVKHLDAFRRDMPLVAKNAFGVPAIRDQERCAAQDPPSQVCQLAAR